MFFILCELYNRTTYYTNERRNMMNIKNMMFSLDQLIESQETFKKNPISFFPIDVSSFHLTYSFKIMIESVDCLLDRFPFFSFMQPRFHLIFPFSASKHSFISTSDKILAVNTVMTFLEQLKINDEQFEELFLSHVGRKKSRVKYIAEGTKKTLLLTNETEKQVFSLYASIFRLHLEAYFGLITEDMKLINSIPFIFELFNLNGTKAEQKNINRFFKIAIDEQYSTETRTILQRMFHNYYQEKNLSFLHGNPKLSFDEFQSYSFLLNKTQIQNLCKHFLKKEEKSIQTWTYRAKAQKSFNPKFMKELTYAKQKLEKINNILMSIS